MPITSSAKKALRAGDRKRVFNLRRKNAIDSKLKEFNKLIVAKKAKEAEAMLPSLYQVVDKAAKTGYIKANTASRTKSRLVAAVRRVTA